MPHIPIDFGRILFPSSYLFPGVITLAFVSLCGNEVSTSTVSLALLLLSKFSRLPNMYEKFVLACLSRQISG